MSPGLSQIEASRMQVSTGHGQRREPMRAYRLLSETLFRDALIRERKRADRSAHALGLVLLKLDAQTVASWFLVRGAVIAALAAAKREIDVLGWYEDQVTIGILAPDIAESDAGCARALEARLRSELACRLDPATVGRLSLQVYLHSEQKARAAERAKPVDALLDAANRIEPRPAYEALKRFLDVVVSATLLILLSPVFLLIAVLIKLNSSGPVLYRQVRVGRGARPFTILKFRTMRTNASHAIHYQFVTSFIKAGALAPSSATDGIFKITNDPRVTTVGHFLRKTSLDELPQFWNVLRGDMSLVGPRPPLYYELDEYLAWHRRRVLDAKPGITGLWQVSGRSRTTFDEMVRLDLRYARTCSLWNDIKILLATPAAVIAGKGAC